MPQDTLRRRRAIYGCVASLGLCIAGQRAVGGAASDTLSNTLTPLTVYDGSWLVNQAANSGAEARTDHLTNHCHMVTAFYTCEQVVNDKAVALLVFVGAADKNQYYSVVVLPDGQVKGRSLLTLDGSHWTFAQEDAAGKPTFRVENFFKDQDHIHFEQYQADANGAWTKVGEGEEARVRLVHVGRGLSNRRRP